MGGRERMNGRSTLCLVVPMYNEEQRVAETIGPLVEFVAGKGQGSQLLLVDDGSTDRTVDVVKGRLQRRHCGHVDVLRRPHAGKGAAIRWGLFQARTDVAAFCDVDLATPLDELDRIVCAADTGSCLAVGSRATDGAALAQRETRRREFAGRAFNRVIRNSLCGGVMDTQCGAKAAPTVLWRTILDHSSEEGFAWDVEVIALSLRLEIPVREIGIAWNHDERTRVRVVQDGVAMVLSVPRIWRRVRRVSPVRQAAPTPPAAPEPQVVPEPRVAPGPPVPTLAPDTTRATA